MIPKKRKKNLKKHESVVFVLLVVMLSSTLASASSINCTVSILPDKPDLSISSSDLYVSPAQPLINDLIIITASVHNIGRANATNVTVTFDVDKNRIATQTIPILALSTTTISVSWTATNVGFHEITVKLDEQNVIDELNEANNQAQKSLKVTKPLAIWLTASPTIIEANGISTSIITAILTDEWGKMVNGSVITFSTNLGKFVSTNTSTVSNVTTNGTATAILRSSTSAGTALVKGSATINGTAVYDTISVVFEKTAVAETNKTITNTTVTIEGTTISVPETNVTIEKGVITINTTLEYATIIAGNTTAGAVISIPIEGGTLEITLKENATAVNATVIGNIGKIKLNTDQQDYITSQPEIGTASVDLDVEFQGTFTPENLALETTLRENYEDLPLHDPSKLKDTLAAHFGVDTSTIANNTPILVHAELSATNLTAADVSGVPMSITVNKDWFYTVAGGDPSKVTMFKLNGTTGDMESSITMTSASITLNDGTVTFRATFDHFSVFAIVAQPAAAPSEAGPVFVPSGGGAPPLPEEITIPIANPGINIFNFEWLGRDITMVSIEVKSMTLNVKAALKQTDKPATIPEPAGIVYSYFDISTDLESENLRSAHIYFRVRKSWIDMQEVRVETIKLCRCTNAPAKGWEELVTIKINEDNEYIYFSAETFALSLFAITGEKRAELTPPATPIPSITPTTPAPTLVSPAPALTQVHPPTMISWIVITVAIVASAIIVSVAYMLLRRIGA